MPLFQRDRDVANATSPDSRIHNSMLACEVLVPVSAIGVISRTIERRLTTNSAGWQTLSHPRLRWYRVPHFPLYSGRLRVESVYSRARLLPSDPATHSRIRS